MHQHYTYVKTKIALLREIIYVADQDSVPDSTDISCFTFLFIKQLHPPILNIIKYFFTRDYKHHVISGNNKNYIRLFFLVPFQYVAIFSGLENFATLID